MSGAHFSTEAGGTPTAPGRYVEVAEVGAGSDD